MGICDSNLTRNLKRDCNRTLARGVRERLYVFQLSQLTQATVDVTNPAIIRDLVMKTGQKLKVWEGIGLSNAFSVGFARSEYGVTLPHTATVTIFNDSPGFKQEINRLTGVNDLVIIYKKNGRFGAFEIVGLDTGMRLSNLTSDLNDENTKGAYVLSFEAPDATTLPHTLEHQTNNLNDTEAYLEGMVQADV